MHLLFTTNNCPNCPRAKEIIEEKGINVEHVNASESEGLDTAREYNIMRVPTLIELNDEQELVHSYSGIEEIEALIY